jgi:cyclase
MRAALLGSLALLAAVSCARAGQNAAATGAHPPPSGAAQGAVAATSPFYSYEITKVGDGVYAFVMAAPRGLLVSGNTLVVEGDDGVLVVDTTHFPSLAAKMIADIRKLTGKPVRYVVNTHWHPDHLFGNGAYRAAYPDAQIVAHAETRRLALKNDPPSVEQQVHIDEVIARVEASLRAGIKKDGTPYTSAERAEYEVTLAEAQQTLGDGAVTLVPPTMTFEGTTLTLFLGHREIRLLHFGRGNTAGDVAVYVPDAKVVATGDLVVAPTPYAYGAYLGEWSEGLGKLAALDATTVLPGHGPLAHDFAYVRRLKDLIDSARSQAAQLRSAGVPVADAKAKIDLAEQAKRFAGDDPIRLFEFKTGFADQAVARGYEEAEGKLSDE